MKKTSALHSYFDQVFLVNLPHEYERKLRTAHLLNGLGISAMIWEATNGYSEENRREFEAYQQRPLGNLHFPEFVQLEIQRGSHFISSPGAWGYLKTYRSILEWSLAKGLKRVLILEDDIVIHPEFETRAISFLNAIGEDWKVIHFGASQYDWSSVDNDQAMAKGYYRPRAIHTCGSFAIGINMGIAQELIEYVSLMEAPFDFIPLGKIYDRYPNECYVMFPNTIIADVNRSSIRESRDQVSHSERMKWNLGEFRFPTPRPVVTLVATLPEQLSSLPLGKCAVESHILVNWLYYTDGNFRPVHDRESPSLRIKKGDENGETPPPQAVSQFAHENPSDYIVLLTERRRYDEREITSMVHGLVVDQTVPEAGRILWRKDYAPEFVPAVDVSVIIPTHRRSVNLENAIASVLNQTYKAIEVIVVDDNAADSSDRIDADALLQRFDNDHRLRVLSHDDNLNASAARNTGLMSSSGKYIAFLDDDDTYMPQKIEQCVARLKELPEEYGGVYGGFVGGAFGGELNPARFKEGDLTEDLLKLAYRENYLNTDTTLFRRSALLKINGYDDSFRRHQDLEMMLRFFQHYRIGVVTEIVAHVRPAPISIENRLSPPEFFRLKAKYLGKFRRIIERFPLNVQREIYYANWNEVKKAFQDDHAFLALLSREDPIGIGLFMYSTILQPNGKDSPSMAETPLDAALRLRELQATVKRLEQQNRDLQYYVEDLLKQKEWYETTYEQLPYLWKKVGALIRKLKRIVR